jgi:hypothetical protein
MARYCDSKVLEKNWFHWLLSSSTPDLERFRESGVLWTKVIDETKGKKNLPNPMSPLKMHCVATATPIYFKSECGAIQPSDMTADLISFNNLSLLSDFKGNHSTQTGTTISELIAENYILELPTEKTWHAMLNDVNKMCDGIAAKFNQPNEDEHAELANEALVQVAKKLAAKKLVYTPGRAPVFNLLTTTIIRCMYSIMNKRTNQRKGLQKYMNEIYLGQQWSPEGDQANYHNLQTVEY